MLSYELAKELRDAGYPIKDRRCEDCFQNNYSYCSVCRDQVESVPTLSELIETLPKVIDGAYFNIYWFDDVWRAAYTITECEDTFADGKTLEEAVANLWLKLNKK